MATATIKTKKFTAREKALLDEAFNGFKARLARVIDESLLPKVSASIESLREEVEKHSKVLEGNGRPGLISEMAVVRSASDRIEAYIEDSHKANEQNAADRQAIFSSLETLKTDLTAYGARLKPLEDVQLNYWKTLFAASFIWLVLGGAAVFVVEKREAIASFIHISAQAQEATHSQAKP
jgi:hypothetical protein